ncbi:MAG: hypothetical protein IPG55_08720 [Saprospiraceae bacterium]|nr:hypothetical protein [Candidatus Defluviibacterium haderslevense]
MIDFNQQDRDEWRELGFYYDHFNDIEWRFFGSKQGLQNFVKLLDEYTNDPKYIGLSEHEHYGPYNYLKIMTWDKPTITKDYIAGRIQDLKKLRNIINTKLKNSNPEQEFNIEKEYGIENTIGAKFFIMPDDFDPASMDI